MNADRRRGFGTTVGHLRHAGRWACRFAAVAAVIALAPAPVALTQTAPTLTAEDRLDILDIAARFTLSLQEGDIDGLAALFATDGGIDHPAGHGEDRAGVRAFFERYQPATLGVRLNSINPVVTANPDGTATMRSALQVIRAFHAKEGTNPPYLIAHALLTDRLRREDGRWVIAKRTVEYVSVNPIELPDAGERARWAKSAAERGLAQARSQ